MSQTPSTTTGSSRFQAIFDAALESYQKQTKKDILTHPLASQLRTCDSTSAILSILQDQLREFDKSCSSDERLTKWLTPTVNVLCAFSAAVSGGVSLVFSPASAIFAGIGIFVLAAKDVAASKDVLAELFERMGFFFKRLETYTKVTPTAPMTDIITEIMVEVLKIFGIATKELRRGSGKKFLRKLTGMSDLEDALKKLDRLTQEEAQMALAEVLRVAHGIRDDVDEMKWNQLTQLLRAWLSPVDPSTNHNIAQKAQHEGTTMWCFRGDFFIEWKSTGSLLWIHGKPGSGKSVICSSVIQRIMAECETGTAIMAYFYFDFRDLKKQTCHDLLLSLISQLSTRSSPCCDILHRIYRTHENGTRQPNDDTLKKCLKEMLRLPRQGPIFIILDALDECPDSSGIPPPRHEVLQLVKELVDLHLERLHICATSRPEVNIRAVLEPLALHSVSLHDESGQKEDVGDYVRSVVNSSLSAEMRRWRLDDKNLIIETLTERADGMFRWVFCQLDALQHCFPQNLRQFLDELPETLHETYERILKGINKTQRDDARRLLHCLATAVRPLSVEELAEILAFDFQALSPGGIPTLKEDWRWDNQEEVILSTCPSLVTIVPSIQGRVVQFSHFSVKEYLTSPRLARSPHRDVSRFHIDHDPAHTIMVQACLGTLLRLEDGNDVAKGELVGYAARHWAEHAQFKEVSSRVRDGMDNLFDSSKPYFAAWLRVCDIDERWDYFGLGIGQPSRVGSPLYYAAFCGLQDLTERLIMKHPEQVNAQGGRILAPLPAALYKKHFGVADLLRMHGAVLDVRGLFQWTPLHAALLFERTDIVRWLLKNGADSNARTSGGSSLTPLHIAVHSMEVEPILALLEHNADINSQCSEGKTPLYEAISLFSSFPKGMVVGIVRQLLEHGADTNIPDHRHSTPLHQASSRGWFEVARLLLQYGANVDEKDRMGRTPFQIASTEGYDNITKLLLEHGAVPQP